MTLIRQAGGTSKTNEPHQYEEQMTLIGQAGGTSKINKRNQ
jgi:hypothetical protein